MPEFHDVAQLFPYMTSDELQNLTDDIRKNGLLEPIYTFQGKVIDGRNRYNACMAASVEPRFQEWDGQGSLVDFVISKNLHRRHMTHGQLSLIAAKAKPLYEREAIRKRSENLRQGNSPPKPEISKNTEKSPKPPIGGNGESTASKVAKTVGVSERSVERATRVVQKAKPEVVEAVESGKMSLNAAEKTVKEPVKPTETESVLDANKAPVPAKLVPIFEACDEFDSALSKLKSLVQIVNTLSGTEAGAHLHQNALKADFDNLRRQIRFGKPHAVCPYCKAKKPKCECCKGLGWVTEDQYKNTPAEMRT